MRKCLFPIPLAMVLAGAPAVVDAHVKWFVDTNRIVADESVAYHLADPAVLVWIGILAVAFTLAYLVDRIAGPPPQWIIERGKHWRHRILYLFQLIIGLSLLVTAYKGAVFAPHLKDGATLAFMLRGMEALVGVLFILNFQVFFGAALLLFLFCGIAFYFGLLASLEYLNLLGVAMFLLILKSPKHLWLSNLSDWALPLLRLHTGVALAVLAFSEKLMHPEFAMAFMEKYNVNFMKHLGVGGFSDHLFILSAGFCELLFGVIFVAGFITRINTLSIAFFLVASNTYFFLLGKSTEGMLEIIGHASLFAIAMIFFFYGAGCKFRLADKRESACEFEDGPRVREYLSLRGTRTHQL